MDSYERSLRRRREIEEGLLGLMQTIPCAQITVTRLTEQLGISRKSFYHYFSNMDACLESLMDRVIRDAALYVLERARDTGDLSDDYVHTLEYWRSQSVFLTALCRNALENRFLKRYIAYTMQEEAHLRGLMQTPDVAFDEDLLRFTASGKLALLLHWCGRGFEPSPEEMAKKYLRLLTAPLTRPDKK